MGELKEPEKAYLEVALEDHREDGDTEALSIAIKDVAAAQGATSIDELETILHRLGYQLSVETLSSTVHP